MATPGELLGRCRFPPPGTPVVCGVSGGADSLALLVLAVEAGCEVTAAHVDHGLRPGSEREAEVVAQAAEQLGARSWAVRISVPPGPNVEARARAARHAALPEGTLLGHTADDRAETLLLNLLRGAGVHGLGALRPDDRHPIVGLRRAETHALCAELGLHPVRDPSNDDPGLRRNRVRHEVLPLLAQVADRDVVPLLVRTADRAAEVADHLDDEAARLDPADVAGLAGAPPVVARAALRTWLRAADPGGQPPDAATLERALGVVRGAAVATDVGGGWRLRRRAGRLHLDPPSEGTAPDLAGP
ncbi:MAG: tRNA lysidine(34) synthetase TilS [Acidimicrobiales bacterium]